MKQDDMGGADFIVGSGEMADLIRRKDWSRTPLGPLEAWPQSLRTTVSLCLASRLPINIVWGRGHIQIYNDGYRAVCGEMHPRALGEGYDVTWASAWPAVSGPFARALAGEASCLENQRTFLARNGSLEEAFFTISLSPIRAENGSIGGVFHLMTETTATMLGERRTQALRALGGALDGVTDSQGLAAAVVRALQPFAFDLPVLMVYEFAAQARCYRLAAHHGLVAFAQQELATLPVDTEGPVPTREALHRPGMTVLEVLPASLAAQPCGPYPEPPSRAVLLPIVVPGATHPPMLLVVGASPRLPFDESYRDFLQLLASSVAGLAGSVRAPQVEAALREAQKLEAVGRLTAGVAHDFNNLMMIVSGGISVLERQPDTARQRRALDGMRRAVERGAALTRQLLAFGGNKPLAARAIHLPACIDGMQALLNRTLGGNVRVVSHYASDLWPVLADAAELEIVLLNLGVNARDAMPRGGTVSITAENASDPHGLPPGDYVRVSVGDTGPGMASGVREPALEPVFTSEESRKDPGAGLAQVHGFARESGGMAEIDGAPGRGTTVTLLLPRSHDAVAAPPAGAVVTRSARAPHTRRVLLVEDDNEVGDLVAEMLEHLGYETVRAVNAVEALFTLQHDSRIDLVFSDVMMPGKMTGIELARRVRRDRPDLPVILTTGYAESFRQEAHAEGLLLLPKPYAIDELGALMERALQARVH